jgi:predicted DNA-binding protein
MASKRKSKRLHLRLNDEDQARLETISETYGVSISNALRIAIRAMLRQMGLDRVKE